MVQDMERLVFECLEFLNFENLVNKFLTLNLLFISVAEDKDVSHKVHEKFFVGRILAHLFKFILVDEVETFLIVSEVSELSEVVSLDQD